MNLLNFPYPDPKTENGGLEQWTLRDYGRIERTLASMLRDKQFIDPTFDAESRPTLPDCIDLVTKKTLHSRNSLRRERVLYEGLHLGRTIGDLAIAAGSELRTPALYRDVEETPESGLNRFSMEYLDRRPAISDLFNLGKQVIDPNRQYTIPLRIIGGVTLAHIEAQHLNLSVREQDAKALQFASILDDTATMDDVLAEWKATR